MEPQNTQNTQMETSEDRANLLPKRIMNYLKPTGLRLCLLPNFGKPGLEIKRVVLGL